MATLESTRASAPGKFILFGEHAVVYGEPALAAPLQSLRARARVSRAAAETPIGLFLTADEISLRTHYANLKPTHPLAAIVRGTLQAVGSSGAPRAHLQVSSNIPIAAGLGSSAATAAAVAQALARFLQHELSAERLSELVFEVEKLQHGTPSGIDNTVVAHEQPVFFSKGASTEVLKLARPLSFVLADSGQRSSTRDAVVRVRQRYNSRRSAYQSSFTEMGNIARAARTALARGDSSRLGELMCRNHARLQEIGVSCPPLDRLVEAAIRAGAPGAKLSGAGLGGHIIAHVHRGDGDRVGSALAAAGARSVIMTELTPSANAA